MTTEIRIRRKKDKKAAFPELHATSALHEVEAVAILEEGTIQGKTSLSFLLRSPTGSHSWVQLTADQLDYIRGAITGAEAHWKENPQ